MLEVEEKPGEKDIYSPYQVKRFQGVEQESEDTIRRVSEVIGPWCTRCWSRSQNKETFITEIIDRKDPRADSPKMKKAKEEEIEGLLKRGTYCVVL